MELILLSAFAAAIAWKLKSQEQNRRIVLLAGYLGKFKLETHMQTLTEGYLRALGEADPERRDQVWNLLRATEQDLSTQFSRLAADIAGADAEETRVSQFPVHIPFATRLLPGATFDFRQLMAVHASGIARAAQEQAGVSARDHAFTMSAELFLMQHSCHWFCKSKTVASARVFTRHKTAYAQLLASVAPQTRAAYHAVTGV